MESVCRLSTSVIRLSKSISKHSLRSFLHCAECVFLAPSGSAKFIAFWCKKNRRSTNKNHIDIVLSDVNMPNMDGYRLTQRIRQLGLTLPVIGVTANALAEEKQRCLESGMDSCLSKPVTLDVIKQTLTVYAERVRKSRES